MEIDNNIYVLSKNKGESNSYHFKKLLFISKCKPKTEIQFKNVLKYANMYCSKLFYNCNYDLESESNLKKLVNEYSIDI